MRIPLRSMRELNDKEYRGQPTAEAVGDSRRQQNLDFGDSTSGAKTNDKMDGESLNERTEETSFSSMNELIRQATEGTGRVFRDRSRTPAPTLSDNSVGLLTDPDVFWYVITQDGRQYGPAQGSVLKTWIKERRVGPKMRVLRSGWKSSLEAGQVFPEIMRSFETGMAERERTLSSLEQEIDETRPRQDGGNASYQNESDPINSLRYLQKRAISALYLIGFLTFALLCAVAVLIWVLLR